MTVQVVVPLQQTIPDDTPIISFTKGDTGIDKSKELNITSGSLIYHLATNGVDSANEYQVVSNGQTLLFRPGEYLQWNGIFITPVQYNNYVGAAVFQDVRKDAVFFTNFSEMVKALSGTKGQKKPDAAAHPQTVDDAYELLRKNAFDYVKSEPIYTILMNTGVKEDYLRNKSSQDYMGSMKALLQAGKNNRKPTMPFTKTIGSLRASFTALMLVYLQKKYANQKEIK